MVINLGIRYFPYHIITNQENRHWHSMPVAAMKGKFIGSSPDMFVDINQELSPIFVREGNIIASNTFFSMQRNG